MANVVRDPHEHPDAIIPDLATNNVYKFSKDQVAFVYGSIWKQRYFTKIGDDYLRYPFNGKSETRNGANIRCHRLGGDWWTQYLSGRQLAASNRATLRWLPLG